MSQPGFPFPSKTEDGLVDLKGDTLEISGNALIKNNLTVDGIIYGTVYPIPPILPQLYFDATGPNDQYRVTGYSNFDFITMSSLSPTFNFYNSNGVSSSSTIKAGTFSGTSASLSSLTVDGAVTFTTGPISISSAGNPITIETNNIGDDINISTAATGNISLSAGTTGVVSLSSSTGSISLNAGLALELASSTFTSINAGSYLAFTSTSTTTLTATTTLALLGSAIELLASGPSISGTVQIGTDAGLLSLTALTGGITLTTGIGALSMIGGVGGISIAAVAGAIAISTTVGLVSISGTSIELSSTVSTTISSPLYISNSSNQSVEFTVPSSFTSYTFSLPSSIGSSGEYLTSTGGGELIWTSPILSPFSTFFNFQPLIGCLNGSNPLNIYQLQNGSCIPIPSTNLFYICDYLIYTPFSTGTSNLSLLNLPYITQSTTTFPFIAGGFINCPGTTNFNFISSVNTTYLNAYSNNGKSALPIPTGSNYIRSLLFSCILFNGSGTSFSPSVTGSITPGSFTYSLQNNQYATFGNLTYFEISFTVTPTSSPVGNLVINTPFTFANINTNCYFNISTSLPLPSGTTDMIGTNNSSSTIIIQGTGNSTVSTVPISTSPFTLTLSGCFMNSTPITFSPTVFGSLTAGTFSYTIQFGEYNSNQDFNLVCVSLTFTITSAPSGFLLCNLPLDIFAPTLSVAQVYTTIPIPSGYTAIKGLYQYNQLSLYAYGQTYGQTQLLIPTSGTWTLNFNVFYHS